MRNAYDKWLAGEGCCNANNFIHIESADCKNEDVCECERILLEISNLHTDDLVLQEQIDYVSGVTDTKLDASAYTPVDLSDYYTKEQVDELIPEVPSLSGYATEQWVQEQGYLTEHQPLKTINGQVVSGTGNIQIDCSGSTVTVDYELNPISTNPVVNSAITVAINEKLDASAYTPIDLSEYVTNAELIQYITNLQQQINSLAITVSGCCGQTGETQYRWVTMTGEDDYWCSGTTKMSKEKEQSSTDGINWTDTGNIRSGSTVLEINSEDCGYEPPVSYKVSLRYINGTVDNRNCDGNAQLSAINPQNWENISGVTVGDCITSIGNLCFYGYSGLTSCYLPNTIKSIGAMALSRCIVLPSIQIPSGVTLIGKSAFSHCYALGSVVIPNGVESIKYATFFECSAMTSITLSNTLKTIDNDAIKFCRSLPSLTLPASLTSIGKHAFAYGNALRTVTCLATTPPAFHDSGETGTGGNSGDIFYGCSNLATIYVPAASVNAYKSAWPLYADKIQAIS